MLRNKNFELSPILFYAAFGVVLIIQGFGQVSGHPTTSIFARNNKLDERLVPTEEDTRDFKQFLMRAGSDSTVIGEIKPNASAMDMEILRKKIASTIQSMKEMEAAALVKQKPEQPAEGECFIELTQVERIPGKCQKVNNGLLSICQSANYMAINSEHCS